MPVRIFTRKISLLILLLLPILLSAQYKQDYSQAEIREQIEKLGTAATILYVAAHPDDENTSLISYFSNKEHYVTNYLSMTRGDGGQNLIGPEISELLGVIRTQELLAARRIDGGFQHFTRTNDFGYSKNAEETLEIWNRDEALADVVWTIRKTRPDVIINRFDHKTSGRTHGHHTSSAILAVEAFDLAGDPTAFPEQLKYVDVWQPKRIFFNTSWWFYGSIDNFRKANKTRTDSLNIGVYLPNLGLSNSEISALSRSMHKCQGFGRAGTRGEDYDYLEFIKGDEDVSAGFMTGINTDLNRIDPSGKLTAIYTQIKNQFDIANPSACISSIIKFMDALDLVEDTHWKEIKYNQAKDLLKNLTGLFIMASSRTAEYTPGDSLDLNMEIIARNFGGIKIRNLSLVGENLLSDAFPLENNITFKSNYTVKIPETTDYTTPYWLNEPWSIGMYTVKDQKLRGKAENDAALHVNVDLEINGKIISYEFPVIFNKPDPVKGEIFQPLAIVPAITMNIDQPVYVYSDNTAKSILVHLKAWKENLSGSLNIRVPEGWIVKGNPGNISFQSAGDERQVDIELIPPAFPSEGYVELEFVTMNGKYNKRLDVIDYDHIPRQYVLRHSASKVVKLDLKKEGELIGYIEGAGDRIPFALRQMGYEVRTLTDKEILADDLEEYDAIITGVRAYNTNERISAYQPHLLKYVENGGTLLVQYNTSRGLIVEDIGPYPMQLSHERVTEEDAEVRFLAPEHPALNYPNKITEKDFENWVQERGLYFATTWDSRYTALFSAHDKGEPDRNGGTLIAEYGKGYYIYSGYSWFRELPAGVSGAYRIFANLVSLKNNAD